MRILFLSAPILAIGLILSAPILIVSGLQSNEISIESETLNSIQNITFPILPRKLLDAGMNHICIYIKFFQFKIKI